MEHSKSLPGAGITHLGFVLVLGLFGAAVNLVPVQVMTHVELYAGSIAVVIAAYFLGPWYAILAAFMSCAYLVLAQSAGFLAFLCVGEAVVLGYAARRGYFLLYTDIVYRSLVAAAVLALGAAGLVSETVLTVPLAIREVVNGVLCTTIGLLTIMLIPFHRIPHITAHPPRNAMSYRNRVAQTLSVFVSFFMLLGSLWFSRVATMDSERALSASLLDHVQQTGLRTENHLADHARAVATAAQLLSSDDNATLERIHRHYPDFLTMLIADGRGRIVAASPARLQAMLENAGDEFNVSDRDYFKVAYQDQVVYTSPVFRGRGFGNDPIVAISAPIPGRGILEGSLDVTRFARLGDGLNSELMTLLLDENARVIYASEMIDQPALTAPTLTQVESDWHPDIDMFSVGDDTDTVYYAAVTSLDNGWSLYGLMDETVILDRVQGQFASTFVVVLLAIFVIIVLSPTFGVQLTSSLEHIERVISSGRLLRDHPLPRSGLSLPVEISRLFENVADHQEQLADRQHTLEIEVEERTQELAASEERWKFAVAGSGMGVWDWDVTTNRIYLSSGWRELFQLDESILGDEYLELSKRVHPDDLERLVASMVHHVWGKNATYEHEHRLRKGDGTWCWVQSRGMVVRRSEDGEPLRVVGTDADITYRVEAEQNRRRETKMQALDRLTGGIAHDYNNLLATILGYAELLRLSASPGSPEAELGSDIARTAKRGENLTAKLLTFARAAPTKTEVIDLGEFVSASEQVMHTLLTSSVQLAVDGATEPLPISVNLSDLEDALLNLCINAQNAMGRHGVMRISTSRVVRESGAATVLPIQSGTFAVMSVEDNGVGMSSDTLGKIFDPYFTTGESGAGLGLSQVYGFMQQVNGDIEVLSERGGGTTFRLYFPLADTVSADPDVLPEEPKTSSGNERILVVDDEEELADIAAKLLSGSGYRVTATSDSLHARDLLSKQPFDLLFTDLTMPNLDGWELGEVAMQLRPGIRILYCTGYHERASERDEVDILAKPYSADNLAESVREVLDRRTTG